MRKLMIVVAAITMIGAGAALPAFARGGGGHGGGGHGGHGGVGHSMGHSMGHGGTIGRAASFGRAGFARASLAGPGVTRAAGVRPLGWHGNRSAFKHHAFRHHRFHRRFAFIGASFGYGVYDSCVTPVWTPWGWRWTNVCY